LLAGYEQQIKELELNLHHTRGLSHRLQEQLAAAAEARAHFLDLYQHGPVPYLVHNQVGFISEANHQALSLLGLRPGCWLGSLTQFLAKRDFELFRAHIRRCLAEHRASTELNIQGHNQRLIPVQVVTIAMKPAHSRGSTEFRSILLDRTQHRKAEAALAETQRDYHNLIDTVEGIVWEADAASLDVLFVNRYAERLLGFSVEDWTRPGFWLNRIYVEDRERVSNEIARAITRNEKLLVEYRVTTAERRLVWLHDTISITERNGKQRLLGVAIDVTQRRHAEQQLREAHDLLEDRVRQRTGELREKVAELEAFSYTLSHDMRSPIRAMQGFATLLERMAGEKLDALCLDYLHRIMRSAERLDMLVRDVLSYSRLSNVSLELRPVPLGRLMDTLMNDFPLLGPPRAEIKVEQPLLPVVAHEGLVGQAVSNLLTNAIKFVPPGQTPKVRVWTEETESSAENGRRHGPARSWVRLCVEDNGVGIAPEDQKRIFKIFERIHSQNEYEGTGIGLAIVRKAVERMGGRFGVQSELGHGSRFWIELPRAQS
jgi:PAS domain S-box-containing protein